MNAKTGQTIEVDIPSLQVGESVRQVSGGVDHGGGATPSGVWFSKVAG
jgi:hypothetical protein